VNTERQYKLLPWLAVLMAAITRIPNLGWGLPDIEEEALPMRKAFEMWGWGDGALHLNPETAGWPSLSFYIHLLAQKIQYAVGRITGSFDNAYDFYVAYQIDPSRTVLIARAIGLVASLVVVWIGTRLALRLGGWLAAVLVASLLVASPLLVQHAQLVTPDILLAMFAALAVWAIVRIHDEGRSRDYIWAGVWIGFGAACKYTPVLLALSIYAVHLLRLRSEDRRLRLLGLNDGRLGWAALASVLSFCIASPYTLASLEVLRRDFTYQAFHMVGGHFGHAEQGVGWLYYLTQVLPQALGWPGLILCVFGLAAAAWRLRGVWLAVIACVLPLYILLGLLSTQFDRYMLPLVMPLSLGAAGAVVVLRSELTRLSPVLRRGITVLLVLVCVVPTGLQTWRYHQVQSHPSTQQIAKQWITSVIPREGTTLAMEIYAPHLPPDLRGEMTADPVFDKLSDAQKKMLLDRPFYRYQLIPFYSTQTHFAAYYYDIRHYYAYDYIVTSSAVRNRYEASPDRFPEQIAFYRDLDRFATLVKTFSPGENTRGPEIRIYRLTQQDKAEILAARGRVQPGEYREWASRLHSPHFLRFVENVATHAAIEELFDIAAVYFQMLYESKPREERIDIMERLAESLKQAGRWDEAEARYTELLRARPRNVIALMNLGYINERKGDTVRARELYEQCARLDPTSRVGQWAMKRLESLQSVPEQEP
jgi:tetratricopeptide (TPR) repeat protein